METFLLKAEDRITDIRETVSIYNHYDKEQLKLPKELPFKNLLNIRDFDLKPNMGILPHKHINRELITIMVSGNLVQKTNRGETVHLQPGDVQFMSAGSGISHFEYNLSGNSWLNCMQVCLEPRKSFTKPLNKTIKLPPNRNAFHTIISPKKNDNGYLPVDDDFYIHFGMFESGHNFVHNQDQHSKGCIVISLFGNLIVNGLSLGGKDTLFIWNEETIEIEAEKATDFFLFEA
ncbi:pirin family protein [Aequorivita echinoideorum]|uniref:Pirin family protein n=1 Tax=Aequorivita echinoideorum TaxID=1549647 RepID=A0ABS5S0F4_9FLAO|nr:pirin family protein [Aequorivita echinoideorum]MBT0606696.1 pirin family protein [Aequorivita echinoideorum]